MPENIYFLDVAKDIPTDVEYDMSIYTQKIDTERALNNITFNIGINDSELNTISKNQRNIDIVARSKSDAIELRKKIQTENQELYNIYLVLTFYSNNLLTLTNTISLIKSKFYSRGINSEISNFRHLEFYHSNLPLNKKENVLKGMYITTDALSNIFPFYTMNFSDTLGTMIGLTKSNNICILDIFSHKYENANMCILGASGSGKSYFTKLFILRNYFLGRTQFVFDVEGEYIELCKNLDGVVLFDDTYVNILDINLEDIKEEDFLGRKIQKIVTFLKELDENIDEEYIKAELLKLYEKFGITSDVDSVMKKEENDKLLLEYTIKDSSSFPTLLDLLASLKKVGQKKILKRLIENELKYFSSNTCIDKNNTLFVMSISQIINYPKVIYYIMDNIMKNLSDEKKTIIYIDEMWKYSSCETLLNYIFNMYKTIRKRNGSIITITQDITDFFEHKDGFYARSILNNSCFKFFFKTNCKDVEKYYSNLEILEENISFLRKGETVLIVGNNTLHLSVKANKFERDII